MSINGEAKSKNVLEGNVNGTLIMGMTPDVQVGKTTTLDPEQNAAVNLDINSTKLKPIFNFFIPKGKKGDTPAKGIDYFTTEEVQQITQDIVKEVNAFDIKVVDTLPTEDIRNKVIYFVPKLDETEQDVYNEYIYIENKWEHIGNTKIDLTDYCKKTELIEVLSDNKKTVAGETLNITDSAEERIYKIDIRGNSKQDGTPTAEAPIENKSCGDNPNILDITFTTQTLNGITITNNGDGSFTLNGTATTTTTFTIATKNITSKDYGYYTLSNKIVAGTYSSARLRMSLKSSDGTSNIMDTDIKEKTTVNIAQNTGDLKVWCEVGVVLNNIRIYPKLEKGRTATEYYGVSYINVNIENNDKTEIQDYLISVQQPMRSIGDIRDTFIKKNGKRYERHWINRIESYNGETITTAYISNTGVLSNGAIVDYVLNEPLDLECTEEQNKVLNEIEYNSKTYQGITHIYSSDEISPYLEIRYVKDISKVLNNV